MIRQAAFINAGKHLKGGLHCHTTRSDGKGDPADVIRMHVENGYDFLALTDHRRYNYQNFAPEAKITIIPGMEMDVNYANSPVIHCHHIVSVGPEKQDGNGFEQEQTFPSVVMTTNAECQEMIDWLHKNNNMTIYCHPEWSGMTAREFEDLEGNFAMEVWNSGCAIEHDKDTNAAYWDELLAQGKRIFGVATDDGHKMNHHCNGWVRVNAENNVASILKALKTGAFYASCGPEIYDFYIEDGEAHIECSEVEKIQFVHLRHPYQLITGEAVTSGSAKIRKGTNYIRAVVTDKQGRRAWTNPIFFEAEV